MTDADKADIERKVIAERRAHVERQRKLRERLEVLEADPNPTVQNQLERLQIQLELSGPYGDLHRPLIALTKLASQLADRIDQLEKRGSQ